MTNYFRYRISITKSVTVAILIVVLLVYCFTSTSVLTKLLLKSDDSDDDPRQQVVVAPTASYNLCPTQLLPSLVYPQYVAQHLTREIASDKVEVYIHESYYNALQGVFHFVITPFSSDVSEREKQRSDDYWNYYAKIAPQMQELSSHLYCWDSLTEMVTPVSKRFINDHAHGEILCPYNAFPHPVIGSQHNTNDNETSTITFVLLTDYRGLEHHLISLYDAVEQSVAASSNISVCIYYRPVVDNSWCSNGLVGPNMEVRLREFVLYHHAIGVDRFLFFDDDGVYKPTFQPFIDAGVVEYVHSTPFYPNQPQGYMQDTYTAICRARYLSSTKWIGFHDIDEFIVMNQPDDPAATDTRIRQGDPNKVIPFILERDPHTVPSMLTSAIKAIQNLDSNRRYQAVGITLAECMPLEDDHPESHSLIERFRTCNRNHDEHKYLYRGSGELTLTGHEAVSHTQFTTEYLNRNQIMIVHYYNANNVRIKYDPRQHYQIPIDIVRRTIEKMERLLPLTRPVRSFFIHKS